MSYISEINELLQICAELIGLSDTVTKDTPEYIDFDQKMESFINRYNLENTRQYQDISQYRLTKPSQYLPNNEARAIIQSLIFEEVANAQSQQIRQNIYQSFER